MSAIVYAVAFVLVAAGVYLARYSGRVRAEATRLVAAAPDAVRAEVEDLRRWSGWNPWTVHEPDVELVLSPLGGCATRLSWHGRQVGAASVEVRRPWRARAGIGQRLSLAQPFGFRGRADWDFAARDGGTEVRCLVRGRVGVASRFFAPTARGALALDLRLGLERLAARVEVAGAPRQLLSYPGVREVASTHLACVDHQGTLDTLAAALDEGVATLRAALRQRGVEPADAPLIVYQGTNVRRRTTRCWIALPVDRAAIDGLTIREWPAHRAFVTRLDGTREGLDVAWYQAMQRLRIAGLAPEQRVAPYERWPDPADGDRAGGIELLIPLQAAPG